jgi:hypothetical protein
LLGTITSHTVKFAISAMPYVTRLLFPQCSRKKYFASIRPLSGSIS